MVLTVALMIAGGYAGAVLATHLTETDARPRGDDPFYVGGQLLGGLIGLIGTGLVLAGVYAWLALRGQRNTGVQLHR